MTEASETASNPAPYSVSRESAAESLKMSTRSVDRYIRRGKLRAQKVGKMVWIHSDDLLTLQGRGWQSNYAETSAPAADPLALVAAAPATPALPSPEISAVIESMEQKIDEKDQLIQDLSYRLGTAEIELKNSVPLADHKRVAFLLEDAKRNLDHERSEMENKVEDARSSARAAAVVNALLVAALAAALCTMGYMWYLGL